MSSMSQSRSPSQIALIKATHRNCPSDKVKPQDGSSVSRPGNRPRVTAGDGAFFDSLVKTLSGTAYVPSTDGQEDTAINYRPSSFHEITNEPLTWTVRDDDDPSKWHGALTLDQLESSNDAADQAVARDIVRKRQTSPHAKTEDTPSRSSYRRKETSDRAKKRLAFAGKCTVKSFDGTGDMTISYIADQMCTATGLPSRWELKDSEGGRSLMDFSLVEKHGNSAYRAVAKDLQKRFGSDKVSSKVDALHHRIALTQKKCNGDFTAPSSDGGEDTLINFRTCQVDGETAAVKTWSFSAHKGQGVWGGERSLDQMEHSEDAAQRALASHIKAHFDSSTVGSGTTASEDSSIKKLWRKGLGSWLQSGIARTDTEGDEGGTTSTDLSANWMQQSREVATAA